MIGSRAGRRSVEERRARRDRDPGGLRARGQGDRAAADVALRGLRVVRDARAGRFRRAVADAASPRTSALGVRRRRLHHARDALLAKPVARRGRDGGRRLRRPLLGRDQRLLRGGRDRSDPHVRLAGDDSGAELRDPRPARRLGPRGRRRDLRGHAALAASPARRPSARGRRRAARRRGRRWTRTAISSPSAHACTRGGRRPGPALSRHPAPPDRPHRADGRAGVASRRAGLAALLSRAVGGVAGTRARLRGGRGSDGGGGRRAPRGRGAARRR